MRGSRDTTREIGDHKLGAQSNNPGPCIASAQL